MKVLHPGIILLMVLFYCPANAQVISTYYQSDASLFGNSYTFIKTDSVTKQGDFVWSVSTDDGGSFAFDGTFTENSNRIFLKYKQPKDSVSFIYCKSSMNDSILCVQLAGYTYFSIHSGDSITPWHYDKTNPNFMSSQFPSYASIPKKEIQNNRILFTLRNDKKDTISIFLQNPEKLDTVSVWYISIHDKNALLTTPTVLRKVKKGILAEGMWERKKGKKVLFIKK
jgi:hypothetical protein